MERASRTPTRGAARRRGAASSAWILGLVAALGVLALGLMWWPGGETGPAPRSGGPGSVPGTGGGPSTAAVGSGAPGGDSAGSAPLARDPDQAGGTPAGLDPAPAPAPATAAGPARDAGPSTTAGRGSIRGRVWGPGGGPPPPDTVVSLAPSPFLVGAKRAVSRSTPVDGEGRYRFDDLPLAGYEVRARYPEGGSEPRAVLLRTGRAELQLDLRLRPRAAVVGRVYGPDGLVVDAIDVYLQRLAPGELDPGAPPPERSAYAGHARTDAGGWFRFEDLEDGAYRLLVGPATAPAIDPVAIELDGRTVQLPRIEVPALGRIELTVTDRLGRPLPEIEIDGFGSAGGLVRGRTDAFGRLSATLLPPGDYRLRTNDAEHGAGYLSVEVPPGAGPVEATLVLGR